jgi:hypothetical protein
VQGHHLEARCGCGYRWQYFVGDDVDPDDEMPECLVCGEAVTDVRVIGQHHSAGADVEPEPR